MIGSEEVKEAVHVSEGADHRVETQLQVFGLVLLLSQAISTTRHSLKLVAPTNGK